MQERQSKNVNVTISILLIFIGLFLVTFNYFSGIKSNLFNKKNIELIEQKIVMNEVLDEINNDSSNEEIIDYTIENEEDFQVGIDEYIGILNVPKVDIKRGFLSPESQYNSIAYNVAVMPKSTMPNQKNGNLILAAHRGNSAVSFFDKLYLLELGDIATINYHNKLYTYKLVNIYYEDKDGELTIRRNPEKTILTLVTCTRDDKTKQTVFIFELDNIE